METLISRRRLLLTTLDGGIGLLAVSSLSPALLSSCQKNDRASRDKIDSKSFSQQNSLVCPDKDALTEQEKALRQTLKYVDRTNLPAHRCDNCKLYTLPRNAPCGGCKIVPGPIHPEGYCTAWIPLM